MTALRCTLCDRALAPAEARCACGAEVAWLEAAPAMLREKLGRAVGSSAGAVAVLALTGCAACVLALQDAGPRDAGVEAATPSVDAGGDR